MSVKFNLNYNTPSDWVKAATAAVVSGLGVLSMALGDGLTGQEIIGVVTAVVVAFGTALGVYSTSKLEPEETPPETTEYDYVP